MNSNKIPVLVLAFNRADQVAQALENIKLYRPDRIYLACDGARPNKPEEVKKVSETRATMLRLVDWECEVKTLFREKNLGCAKAVSSAISWFFEHEEFGAIIEDDVVVSVSFFKFCEEMGARYANNDRILMITAQYFENVPEASSNTYGFSNWASIWGWATWKRAWAKMDMSMSCWPKVRLKQLIQAYGFFQGIMYKHYWSNDYRLIKENKKMESWGTRWAFSVFVNEGMTIVPMVNLSKNIGCNGVGGAHYEVNDEDPYSYLELGEIKWPLVHPDIISLSKKCQSVERRSFLHMRIIGLKKKIRKIFRSY